MKAKFSIIVGLLIVVLTVFIITGQLYAAENIDTVINMDFKGADIRDVLRTIAELAGVNLVTDGSVAGEITIKLKDITFIEALNFITRTSNLAYRWDGNTVVVASPEQIEKIYPEINTKSIKIKNADSSYIKGKILELYPEIKIIDDTVNEQLIISGKGELVKKSIELIRKLDISVEEQTVVYNLKNLSPADVKGSMEKYNEELKISVNESNRQVMITGPENVVQEALAIISTMDKSSESVIEIIPVDYIDIEQVKTVIEGLYGDVKLQQNLVKKELVIMGKKNQVSAIKDLVKRIDTPRKQVIIEAKIQEISRTKLREMGVNPEQLSRLGFTADESGWIQDWYISWPEYAKALADDSGVNTLANPSLMTLNGQEAKLLIGDRIPVQVETVEDGNAKQSIEYIDAGITLRFTPWVSNDGKITLEIAPKVSTIGESIGTSIPPINTREVETTVTLKDGQTLAIGGLIQEEMTETMSRVPIISSIPILGELFKYKKNNKSKTELVIFITPHIVEDSSSKVIEEGTPFERDAIKLSGDDTENVIQKKDRQEKEIANAQEKDIKSSSQKEEISNDNVDDINIGDDKKNAGDRNPGDEEGDSLLTSEELDAILNSNSDSRRENDGNGELVTLTDEELMAILKINENTEEDNTVIVNDLEKNKVKPESKIEPHTQDNNNGENLENPDNKSDIAYAPEINEDNNKDGNVGNTRRKGDPGVEKENLILDPAKYFFTRYTIKKNENLDIISMKFKVKKQHISDFNTLRALVPGKEITIPVPINKTYKMKKGDTLWKVHSMFNIEVELLKDLNEIKDVRNLPVGIILVVPTRE